MRKTELAVGAVSLVILTAAITALTTSVLKTPIDDTQDELSRMVYISVCIAFTCLISCLVVVGVALFA